MVSMLLVNIPIGVVRLFRKELTKLTMKLRAQWGYCCPLC